MFFVLEGIDGSGGGTQRKLLAEYFARTKDEGRRTKEILTLKYPYYETPIGKMIKEFLYSDTKFPPEKQFLLFFSQWAFESPKIEDARKDGMVIADRWVTSGIVYQGVQGIPTSDLIDAARIFKLAVPDVIFFLDVPPSVALSRDQKGKEGEANRFESKKAFLMKCYEAYQNLMRRKAIAPWIRIDGTPPIADVTKKLMTEIERLCPTT